MSSLIRGQKIKLSDITPSTLLQVGVAANMPSGITFDISCFGVDAHEKLSDDRYFIFYNQKSSPCGAIKSIGSNNIDTEQFEVALSKIPSSIRKLVFVITIDGNGVMSQLTNGYLRLLEQSKEIARFSFTGADFQNEKAIMVAEIYLKDVWRFAAVGQGFNGGLSALLKYFGGEEIKTPSPPVLTQSSPSPPKINLSKITLEKRGDTQKIDIRKKDIVQPIHINLNWDTTVKKRGFFGDKIITADLDLGCMFSMTDNNKGIVQALGNKFGSKTESPFISLDKDDRTGLQSDGENLYIMRPDLIDMLMVFTFIYEGTANFADVKGRITIKDKTGNEINIKLNNPDPHKTFCAICSIRNIGNQIEIKKDELYFTGHKDADKFYGFGFNWVAVRK